MDSSSIDPIANGNAFHVTAIATCSGWEATQRSVPGATPLLPANPLRRRYAVEAAGPSPSAQAPTCRSINARDPAFPGETSSWLDLLAGVLLKGGGRPPKGVRGNRQLLDAPTQ